MPHSRASAVQAVEPSFYAPSLPGPLEVDILGRLSVTDRLLAAGISRSFRAAVSDERLWLDVDLSSVDVAGGRAADALLRAVLVKTAGRVQRLRLLVGRSPRRACTSVNAALVGVRFAGASLRHLELLCAPVSALGGESVVLLSERVDEVLRCAPRLVSLVTDVGCLLRDARFLLLNEERYLPLRVRRLCVSSLDDAQVLLLAGAMSRHASLQELVISNCELLVTVGSVDALVNAVLAHRLVALTACFMHPTMWVLSLARLLRDGAQLTSLAVVKCCDEDASPFLVPATSPAFAAALQNNSVLTVLRLEGVNLWEFLEHGCAVVNALVAHPSLRELSLARNDVLVNRRVVVGHTLGHLVGVDAAALRVLNVSECSLDDDGSRPLFRALRGNTRLVTLRCHTNGVSDTFARHIALPCVRHNASLRCLQATTPYDRTYQLVVAERLVAARSN